MSDTDDLRVFDDPPDDREPTGACRICETNLYHRIGDEDADDLCFQCWVRRDKAEAEYIAVLTHGGTR
jgi:hypothetical protein